MKTAARIMATACKLALVIVFIPVLAACSNESNDSRTVTVSLSNLQSQLGYGPGGSSSAVTAPTTDADNPAVSVAKSIAVGAMVVNSRSIADGPYSFRVPISDVEGQLESDIRNSANFIVLRNLPTDDLIEIQIPPAGSQKYQIIAAALTTQPATVGDLGEAEHQDSVIYIGFDEFFLKTSAENQIFRLDGSDDDVTSITITLIRACLVEPQAPPKGCAQFDLSGSAVVSSAVEITAMYTTDGNGDLSNNLLGSFPLIVRSGSTGAGGCTASDTECSPAAAAAILEATLAAQSGVTSVEVHTTHQLRGGVDMTDCEAATTNSGLETECGVQVFFTPL